MSCLFLTYPGLIRIRVFSVDAAISLYVVIRCVHPTTAASGVSCRSYNLFHCKNIRQVANSSIRSQCILVAEWRCLHSYVSLSICKYLWRSLQDFVPRGKPVDQFFWNVALPSSQWLKMPSTSRIDPKGGNNLKTNMIEIAFSCN